MSEPEGEGLSESEEEGAEWYVDHSGDSHSLLHRCGAPHPLMPAVASASHQRRLPTEAAVEMVQKLRRGSDDGRPTPVPLWEVCDYFCVHANTIINTVYEDPKRFFLTTTRGHRDVSDVVMVGAWPSERHRSRSRRPHPIGAAPSNAEPEGRSRAGSRHGRRSVAWSAPTSGGVTTVTSAPGARFGVGRAAGSVVLKGKSSAPRPPAYPPPPGSVVLKAKSSAPPPAASSAAPASPAACGEASYWPQQRLIALSVDAVVVRQ